MNRVRPTVPKMLGRAALLKCPWCGSRRTFIRRWLQRYDRCRTCGLRWHREHGFELGPIALNVVITFGALAIGMVVGFVATAPDFPVTALTIGFVVGAIVVPLVAFPFTNTLWFAVDLATHPPGPVELAEAETFVASGDA
jgi:uncharacterized protein (DUF983 family)